MNTDYSNRNLKNYLKDFKIENCTSNLERCIDNVIDNELKKLGLNSTNFETEIIKESI